MPPGDRAVPGTVEAAIMDRAADRFIQVGDQAVHDGDAGQQAEVALGGGEGEIDLISVAPGRDLVAAAQDQPIGGAARTGSGRAAR